MTARGVARRVLVLGGTSEIARAIVRELVAGAPCEVVLAGRDAAGLEEAARELRGAGCAEVGTLALEARDRESHAGTLAEGFARRGGVDVVLLAVGVLGERGGIPRDIPGATGVLEVNTVGAGSLLLHAAELLRGQGHGTLVVLSSVAAERARAGNAVYCASKAGLDALAQGIGDALEPSGARVMVVRPGFVKTRMTRGLDPAPLACTPEVVARATVRGLERGLRTVWAPARLRWPMLVVRLLPRGLFRRLPL
ncbi:MAG TPA: SDR family NAD(P)-dependent oxidoreductase [Solirubrobacteraceae bacterium]|nr:SDR family NAD(P)-dependent oxidoreductase [Solirubrobacteraceae bacterium]